MANTPNLDLPQDAFGHVRTQEALVEGFKKIDDAVGDLGGETVAEKLAAMDARIADLEAAAAS